MSNTFAHPLRHWLAAIAGTAAILLGVHSQARAIDHEVTKQIWKLKFGISDAQLADSAWQNADSDGDGILNKDEIYAGTNPLKAGKAAKVSSIVKNGNSVDIQFPTELGKRYRVQSTSTLGNPASWVFQTSTPAEQTGDGNTKQLSVSFAANTFYRIYVDDIDTDQDGVSDWAEQSVSLNPNAKETVTGTNDLTYVTQQVALPNIVTITPADTFASEDGPTAGRLTVTRSQNLFPITVGYSTSGTAVPGTDYATLTGSVGFPARGATSADIFVNPIPHDPVKGSRSVTATLNPAGGADFPFNVGTPNSATVIINESAAATGTGLLGRYYDTATATYADAANLGQSGTFTYSRIGAAPYSASTILIPFTYTGSPALQIGHLVRLSFTSGALDGSSFDNQNYAITAINPGVSFTVGVSGASLPASYSPAGSFSLQSIPHPPVIQRVDPTVNFEWMGGTPNGNAITPANSPDNYSSVWEGYLHPTTAGSYTFQLDADDKARVLLDTGSGLVQILEHGWDGPATVGTFKQSAPITLAVPATPAERYRIRVEHVETTGEARCRLQWKLNNGAFANIPQANIFTHTQAATYAFTRTNATTGTATITLTGHGLANGNQVPIAFSGSNLFTPNASDPAGYSGTFTVANATANTFEIAITGTNLPASVAAGQGCFLENRSASTTTGWFNRIYANTTFSNAPGRVGTNNAGPMDNNNGLYGTGTPDVNLINPDTFSIRWTGQVQPQFSEEYTFVVHADEGCALKINGKVQQLKTASSTSTGGNTYLYNSTTGNALIVYGGSVMSAGSFVVGESVRLDPSSGNLQHNPSTPPTYSYDSATGIAVITYSSLLNVTPGNYVAGDTVELDPTSGSLAALGNAPYTILADPAPTTATFAVSFGTGAFATGAGNINVNDTLTGVITAVHAAGSGTYAYNATTGDLVVTYSNMPGVPAGSFAQGGTVQLDPTSGNLGGLAYLPYSITAATQTTFTVNVGAGLFTNGSTGNVSIADPRTGIIAPELTTAFTVHIADGRYANNSAGSINVECINKGLKDWSSMGNERYVRIPMIGGVRYDIQLDYWESSGFARCILYWYSQSQPRQVIPAERLYPSSVPQAPASHVSSTDAVALVGGPFSYQVAGSNAGTATVTKPDWLNYDSNTGILSGIPPIGTSGNYQVIISLANPAGTSASVLNLRVDENAGQVRREYWPNVVGTTIASLQPALSTTATVDPTPLTKLEAPSDFGDNYGARIRGYITAPTTGNYYFWIAGNNAAELWISNDEEPVNVYKRAWLTTGSVNPRTWNTQTTQKSPWLALEQGRKYYFEVLHKAGASGNGLDNLAVGWSKPGEDTAAPSEVVPGYVLSPWVELVPISPGSTVYSAILRPQGSVVTNASGASFIRLNAAETEAVISIAYSGLSSSYFGMHVHDSEILGTGLANVICDLDQPGDVTKLPDGTYRWVLKPVAGRSVAQLVNDLKTGKCYFNVHSLTYKDGEIKGYYSRVDGSQTFTAPAAPPAWTDDSNTAPYDGAARFLAQATFGGSPADIAALKALSPSGATNSRYETWINNQFNISPTQLLPEVLAREVADVFGPFDVRVAFNTWWKTSISAPDQLRQRVAFALSQIHVVSGQGPLEDNSRALADFYDTLAANAFGNFRDILVGTTLTPAMGRYLDMLRNDKPDISIGRSPNENYAREIKQLFSIGLYRMWPDGTLILNSRFEPVETYTQREIVGLAHVFTGWDYGYDGAYRTAMNAPTDWTRPMREVPARHFTGEKRVLNNEVLPGLTSANNQPLDPNATHPSVQYTDPSYVALAGQEFNAVHDMLFNHPNTAPFICRQLIQRLVTSNPSSGYVYRVVQKFNDNGAGVRGDMKAVIKAILLDYEARSSAMFANSGYGKQREPVLRIAQAARTFRPNAVTGTYSQTGALINGLPVIAITTSAAHRLDVDNNVFLEFTDTTSDPAKPAPPTGTYRVITVPNSTSYTIYAPGWITGNYSQANGSNVMTITLNGHWLPAGGQAYFDFTSGGADNLANFDRTVRNVVTSTAVDFPGGSGNVSGPTFTITAPNTTAKSGTVMIPRFAGTYQSTGAGGTITIDTVYGGSGTFGAMADHNLAPGDSVYLNFVTTRDTTSGNPTTTDNDTVYPIVATPDLNTFTVTALPALNAAIGSDNNVFVFPLKAQPLVRNGTITTRLGTYTMDNTDADLQQTPLNSPTVFNFFLPDYKFAGTLATQNMTTPEFQLTSETTVIRQANFIYNGIFNPDSSSAMSSFKTGGNALVMDLNGWMGNAVSTAGTVGAVLGAGPQTGQAWTSNANVGTLIDRMNTLLLGGRLPTNAKTEILKLVGGQISSITTGSPCTFNRSTAHGLLVGDTVTVTGISGGTFSGASTSGNGTFVVSSVPTSTSFRLTNVNCSSTAGINLSNSTASVIPYTNASPSSDNKRDRLRAILHIILTSPDYTIQR